MWAACARLPAVTSPSFPLVSTFFLSPQCCSSEKADCCPRLHYNRTLFCFCVVASPAASATVPQCAQPAFMPDPMVCVSAWHEPFVSSISCAGTVCAASNCINHICHCSGQAVCCVQMHTNQLENSLGAAATADNSCLLVLYFAHSSCFAAS